MSRPDLLALGLAISLAGCPQQGQEPSAGAESGAGTWSAMDAGAGGEVHRLVTGPGGVLYGTGYFGQEDREGTQVLREEAARWDGSAWTRVSANEKETVHALATWDDGSGPAVHAIVRADGRGYRLCKLVDGAWTPVGDSIEPDPGVGVGPLQAADLGGGPRLFAGGVNGTFAWWDGEAWTPQAGGFLEQEGAPDAAPFALVALKRGEAQVLCLGGWFKRAGPPGAGVECLGVVLWDGKAYAPLGAGIDAGDGAGVRALCAVGEELYAAGQFVAAGGSPARSVARWDGKAWHPLGAGVEGEVNALAWLDGKLYAGGELTRAGEVEVQNIAVWDGERWDALGAGVDDAVHALLVHEGSLIVAGEFRTAGGVDARNVARWRP